MSNSPKQEISEGEDEYEVERLVNHRRIKQRNGFKNMYLVKWKNYDDAENTWEKEEDIYSQELIDDYWRREDEKKKDKPKRGKRSTLKEETGMSSTNKSKRNSALIPDTKPTRRRLVRRNASSSPSPSGSSVTSDSNNEAEKGKESVRGNTSIVTRDINDKPPEGYQWSDANTISHIYIDTAGNLLAKITWPNGEETYSSTGLIRTTAPNLLLDFYEAHLKFGPIDDNNE